MRTLRFAVAAAMFTMLAGACNTSGSPGVATAQSPATAPTSAVPQADMRDQALKYVKCMRDEGVNLDDPDPVGKITLKPGDKTDPEYPAAFTKCRGLLPEGFPNATNPLTPEQLEKLRQYAKCMRDNGVPDFADPGPQGFTIAPKDPAAAAKANLVCAPIIGVNPSSTAGQG